MSILGKKSGVARQEEAAVDDAAVQVLSGPRMGAVKLALDAIGVDLDAMIEKHGAPATVSGLLQLGSMIGLDVPKLLSDGVSGVLPQGPSQHGGVNPYLKM